ncbi:hypothetical protein HAX54_046032 [Datura stramonium]|uniref:Uncharacterized protein n=1 Tax=Datura stramonium TaxID=4076 RepID=A0ABS8WKD2_DATST|nr:hypothetical protein [Datura stramonium]
MPFYRILRMGCGVSKIDANGVATPNRSILPNFPTRRRQSTKCTPSKKESYLLMQQVNDDVIINRPSISPLKSCDDNLNFVSASEGSKLEEDDKKRIVKIMTIVDEAEKNDERGRLRDDEEDQEAEEEGNDDDQRAISKIRVDHKGDGNGLPSSPSFKVYFNNKDVEIKKKNDDYNKVGLNDTNPVSSTKELELESESVIQKEKTEIRKRSTLKNVLSKNLLNVRSSPNSSTRSPPPHHKVAA